MTTHPRTYCSYCEELPSEDPDKLKWILRCCCHENSDEFMDWHWAEPDETNNAYCLSENNLTVRFHPDMSVGTCVVRGDKIMSSGIHYWELKALSHIYGTSVMIGAGLRSFNLNTYTDQFCCALGINSDTWGLTYQGTLKHGSNFVHLRDCKFKRGSIIGCLLDLWHSRLYFFINGRLNQRACFHNLPLGSFYPMVSATSSGIGFRLIRAHSYPATLQLTILQSLCINDRDFIDLYLPRMYTNLLPYALFVSQYQIMCSSDDNSASADNPSDPYLWTNFKDPTSGNAIKFVQTDIYDDIDFGSDSSVIRDSPTVSDGIDTNLTDLEYFNPRVRQRSSCESTISNYNHELWGEFVDCDVHIDTTFYIE